MKRLKTLTFFIFYFSFSWHCSAQIITTIAGNGVAGYSGDGGPATVAELYYPYGVAVDDTSNVYIADGSGRIRKVNTYGIINTIAGNGVNGYSGDGGPATAAEISPYGIAIDKAGNIYIADNGNSRIREVNTLGIINTLAGNGVQGYTGDGGPATLAELNTPFGVRVDKTGNVYIADIAAEVVRMVDTMGIIHTFAGNGYQVGIMDQYGGYSGNGGPATAAELDWPRDVDFDNAGNVYIADQDSWCVRQVNNSGIISTFAGIDYPGNSGDSGPATNAELDGVFGVTVNDSGVYIVDNAYYHIMKVNSSGIISAFAGNGTPGFSGDGGTATSAEILPLLLATDTSGNMYISDQGNNRIRKVSVVLQVSTNLITNVNCNGGSNGSATASANEGIPPYTYSWSNGATTSSVTNLSAGTNTVFVTDSENIKGSATVIITQPPPISMTADSINVAGTCNGSAWVIVGGGTPSYSYLWTGGLTTDTITNQCIGDYCCTVTDANGCIDSVCTTIESATGTSEVKGESEKVKVYPNPNNGLFTIALSSHAELVSASQPTVKIYNLLGQQVYVETLKPVRPIHPGGQVQGDNLIDLSDKPNGIYFYRVLKEDGSLIEEGKVIIDR